MIFASIVGGIVSNTFVCLQDPANGSIRIDTLSPLPAIGWSYSGTVFSPPIVIPPQPPANPAAGQVAFLSDVQSLAATLSLVATSDSYTDLINLPLSRSASSVTRSIGTSPTPFQVSATRDCFAVYTISVSASLSLSGGQIGTVTLLISSTSGGTYTPMASSSNGNTGALTIGLNIVQTLSAVVVGMIPAGYYAKLVSSGTATMAYVSGQEMLF